MAKRLSGTEKWDKAWFRKLKPKYKCFWEYLRDKCDLIGLWEIDFESASFHIGEEINEEEVFKFFKGKIKHIGDKILLLDFCHFQYGQTLNPKSPIHKKIIDLLNKNRVYDTLYNRVVSTGEVKEEVKEEDKVKVKEEVKEIVEVEKFSIEIEKCYKNCLSYFPEHLQPKNNYVDSWKETIEKLNRIDKIEFGHIEEIVKKTREDTFWSNNFLSLNKLRKKNKDGVMYVVVFFEKFFNHSNNAKSNNNTGGASSSFREKTAKRLGHVQSN
jgi:hypothetical protein